MRINWNNVPTLNSSYQKFIDHYIALASRCMVSRYCLVSHYKWRKSMSSPSLYNSHFATVYFTAVVVSRDHIGSEIRQVTVCSTNWLIWLKTYWWWQYPRLLFLWLILRHFFPLIMFILLSRLITMLIHGDYIIIDGS